MPAMHHLLSHNAFAQQPSSGSLYISPAVAPPGVKIPFPAFKPAANTNPMGISGYGSYASIGYTATPSVSSGTSSGNEDLASTQLKENQIYSNPQLVSFAHRPALFSFQYYNSVHFWDSFGQSYGSIA